MSCTDERTLVMGVLNVTPDSFSDGGRWADTEAAVQRGRALAAAGADLVDVGGESTRPGARRVSERTERERVLPVVAALSGQGVAVSVDTTRAALAREAVTAGAVAINDVSGALADPAMAAVMAECGVTCIVMHWRGPSVDMQTRAGSTDYGPAGVVTAVRDHLRERRDALADAGVDPQRVVVDPGLGFAKTAEQNWALLRALGDLVGDGAGVLVGASRKAFLGALLDSRPPAGRAPDGRDDATAAVSALAAAAGAWGVRVHEVAASVDAVRVGRRWGSG